MFSYIRCKTGFSTLSLDTTGYLLWGVVAKWFEHMEATGTDNSMDPPTSMILNYLLLIV